jgi:hypothetical protein
MKRDRKARSALLLGIMAGVLKVVGCGPTEVPTSQEPSDITGRIVDATDPTQGIADAYVYVPPRPPVRGAVSARGSSLVEIGTTSGPDGSYTLKNVPPGSHSIIVEPPASSGYAGVEIDLGIPGNTTVDLRLTLPPLDIASTIATVVVDPASAEVPAGATSQFTATVLCQGGSPLDLTPVFVVTGGVGTIDQNGLFTAGREAGTGTVVAIAGATAGTAVVMVASSDPASGAYMASGAAKTSAESIVFDLPGNFSGYLSAMGASTRQSPERLLAGTSDLHGSSGLELSSGAETVSLSFTAFSPDAFRVTSWQVYLFPQEAALVEPFGRRAFVNPITSRATVTFEGLPHGRYDAVLHMRGYLESTPDPGTLLDLDVHSE